MSEGTTGAPRSTPMLPAAAGRRRTAAAMLMGHSTMVAITVAQAFLLVPLCLRFLGVPLYGAWIAAAELLLWVQQFDAGLTHLLTQRVGAAIGAGRPDEAARWSSTCFWIVSGIAVLLMIIAIGVTPFVVVGLRVPVEQAESFASAFRVGVMASGGLLMSSMVTALARGIQQPMLPTAAGVIGAVAGLLSSMGLLLAGWGVWSLALGLLCRTVIVSAASVVFLVRLPRPIGAWLLRPSRHIAMEIRGLLPSMSAGSAGYLVANNSEIVLVTALLGPVVGVTYALTRRTVDGLRSLVESLGLAVAPGFAHLIAADDRHRSRRVLREVRWLRLAAACLGAAVLAAINEPFVALVFGAEHFGGTALTALFLFQFVLGGQAGLLNHVLRSAGAIRESGWLKAAEAALRLVFMALGISLVGLLGAPAASLLVSFGAWWLTRQWVDRVLPPESGQATVEIGRAVLVPLIVLAGGIGVAISGVAVSFWAVSIAAIAIGITGALLLWTLRPSEVRTHMLAHVESRAMAGEDRPGTD